MTNYFWSGSASTSASDNTNWLPVGSPAAGDVVIFNDQGLQDCDWDIALPASAFSVDEIIIESDFTHSLNLIHNMRVKGLFLDGTVAPAAGTKIIFEHGASPNFFGSYKTYNERFALIGDSGDATGVIFEMLGSSTPVTKFDDGAHPTVTLTTGRFAPDYVAPTGTSGKATFDSFTVSSPTDFSPDGDLVDNDRLKVFSFTAFSITSTSIDFGLATVEYYATVGGFYIPTAGANGMPSGFEAYYRKIVLKANTAGHKCLMSDNTYISVEEFEIDDGVVLKGPVDDTSQGADIRSIKTPKLRGTWSFSQISPGIYRSPRHASGPMPKVNGDFHITGKLDVDGLIDPTGLELNPQASNPGGVAANTLWLNSGDSNKLYLGSSEVGGGGGGGSGTVTSVALTGSDGIEVDSGSPITTSGTIALGVDKTSMLSHLNVDDGADVTNATNVQAAGALMDSEVTNLAQVKAFNSADYATAAQGAIKGQYQKFVLDSSITSLTNGSTEQLSFGQFGLSGSALLYEQYDPTSITDFSFNPVTPDYLTINADGLYQFTFAGFLAGISGGSTIDYRLTISSTSSNTGDILSFRNRTSTIDRYSGSGVSTVYLTTGSQVFFSAFCAGRTWEIGGVLAGPETRTFIDVRRLE